MQSAVCTIGGVCVGAGVMGAALLSQQWSMLTILGMIFLGVAYVVEINS